MPALAQSALNYEMQGQELVKKKDLDGARLSFTYAVALAPDDSEPLLARAEVELRMNLLHEAMDDCNRAIMIQPQFAKILYLRARIYLAAGDLEAARENVNLGLAARIADSRAYAHAALEVTLAEGRLDDVITFINRYECDDPKRYHWYSAIAEQLEGKDTEAVTNFEERAKLDNPSDEVFILIWVLLTKNGNEAAANDQLSRRLASGIADYPKDWRTLIMEFLLGRVGEADFFAKAQSSNAYLSRARTCEFFYYAGIKRLIAGDKATAIDDFRRSVATMLC